MILSSRQGVIFGVLRGESLSQVCAGARRPARKIILATQHGKFYRVIVICDCSPAAVLARHDRL
ncbi:MAG: hypothetical protein OJF48_002279 [Afipia sp.]|nr:MAG: hypothetical protein OJF48_002279 [Afipia sp.]